MFRVMVEDILTILIIFSVFSLGTIIRIISDVAIFNRKWSLKKDLKSYLILVFVLTIIAFVVLKIMGFEFPYF